MTQETAQPQETSSDKPVLVFQINAWKAKRWGQKQSEIDVVSPVFEHNTSENAISTTIAEILKVNELSNIDIINIVPMEPPAHARADIGSMELWMFCRNPKFGRPTAPPSFSIPRVQHRPIVRDGVTIQPLSENAPPASNASFIQLKLHVLPFDGSLPPDVKTLSIKLEKSPSQVLAESRAKKKARREILRTHTNRQVYVPYPPSEKGDVLVPAVLKGRDSRTASGIVVCVGLVFNEKRHYCASEVYTEIPDGYTMMELSGWRGAYVKNTHPRIKTDTKEGNKNA